VNRVIKPDGRYGFTLVEILLAVTIIGLLAAFIIPVFNIAIRSRENAHCASKLRQVVAAFTMYRSEMGSYPADRNPGVIPPEMTDYFAELNIDDWWSSPTELGGGWDWDNGYHYNYSVSISAPTKSAVQLTEFDKLIDDGVLSTGNFRQSGTQYHYIIEK
jgi:prepilin-type N-terminal cleavage/methylation domain-containing protein